MEVQGNGEANANAWNSDAHTDANTYANNEAEENYFLLHEVEYFCGIPMIKAYNLFN